MSSKKKGDRKKSEYLEWIIAAAVLLGYFLIVLLSYYGETKDFAKTTVDQELAIHVKEISESMVSDIRLLEQANKAAASMLSDKNIGILDKENLTKLGKVISCSPADIGVVIDIKGLAMYPNGVKEDYAGNRYFNAAMSGDTVVSEMEYNDRMKDYCISVYSPVVYGKDIKGVVSLVMKTNSIDKVDRISGQDGNTIFAMLNSEGTMVALKGVNAPANGTNIYDFLGGDDDNDAKKLAQYLDNEKNGVISVTINDEDRVVKFSSLGINEWYAAAFYTQKYVDRREYAYYKGARAVVIKSLVALFAFFMVMLFINVFSQRIYNKKNKELQNKAETDLLTGMLNKIATERHIQDYLDNEGKNIPGMLILIDVDNFKKINDTMGHAFGDQVLSTLGQTISNEFRVSDIFGRIGGDEFMLYLKNIPNDEIRDKEAKKLVNFFKNFQAGDYVKYSVGASIGVSMYPKDGENFEELYKAADKAVYRSKQEGKNQLRFYSDEDKIVKA